MGPLTSFKRSNNLGKCILEAGKEPEGKTLKDGVKPGGDGKMAVEERISRLEGVNEQILERLNSLEANTNARFNTVLLNLYRHERDSVAWHSDDEAELGHNPVIASVSFGAERLFRLRHKARQQPHVDLLLPPGSLLLMGGETQHHWQHCIPKMKQPHRLRLNLTYRLINV